MKILSAPARCVEGGTKLETIEYDVVIVGGGTAGSVVASRLSADPGVRVCVIEGGPSDVGDERILRLRNWRDLLERHSTTTIRQFHNHAVTLISGIPGRVCWVVVPRTTP